MRYTEAYQRLHPQAQAAVIEAAGGWATYVNPGSPLNSARGLGFSGPVRAADFDLLEEFCRARGVSVRLHICPLADPSLLEHARARGYVPRVFFSVLVRAIPPGFEAAAPPPGVTIRPASADEAGAWLQASALGFGSDEPFGLEGLLDILGPNFHAEDVRPFGAWIDDPEGRPTLAGTGGMYVDPSTRALELGGASTLPAFRRMGIQRALIEARLAEGRRLGCDLAVVLTSPGSHSESNLRRAGFELAYTKVVVERLEP